MAVAVVSSGTVTTDGTEQTLATSTTGKTYVLTVSFGPASTSGGASDDHANGDIIELSLKTKVLSGSTEYTAYQRTYAHAQAEPNVYSVPVPANQSCKATIKKVSGSNRKYDWALLSID